MPAGQVRFAVPNGSGSDALVGESSILPINTWHYVYMIFRSNGECSGYINNSLIGTYINVGGLGGLTTNMFSIGTTQYGNNAFNGYIDDLRIYNQAVPITDISSSIFTQGNGVAGNPRIGAAICDSQVVLTNASNSNTLDIVSDAYYNTGYTEFSTTIQTQTLT